MRRKFFYWICKITKHQQNNRLPKWLIALKAILFPLEWYLFANIGIRYEFVTDTIVIDGIRYSREIFHDWSKQGIPDGQVFRLDKRENGIIYLTKISHVEPPEPWPRR